jgi:collagen type VII alpha
VGFVGSKGDPGGYTGSQGIVGFTGSKGDAGNIGFTGSQGYAGSVGYTGSKGLIGGAEFVFQNVGFNYSVDGFADTTYPTLTLVRGQLYYFNLTNITNSHPLALRLASGSTSAVPGTTGNNPTSGVYGGGTTPTIVTYQVPFDAPSTIYYQCVFHSGMIGSINIVDQTGYTGSTGNLGYTGSQGDIGFTGSRGVTGYDGSQGIIGYYGSKGDAGGYTGSQGAPGYSGSAGYIGVANDTKSPNSDGSIGQFAYDNYFLYLCVDTNTWIRVGAGSQLITEW